MLDEQVGSRKFLILPQSNIFLFDNGRTEKNISKYIFLESLEIRKKLPRTIIVEMVEKPISAVLLQGNRFLALDEEAFVVRELIDQEVMALEDLPPDMVSVLAGELGAEVVELDDEEIGYDTSQDEDFNKNRNPYPLILKESGIALEEEAMLVPGNEAMTPVSLRLIVQAYDRLPDITDESVRWFTIPELSESVDVTMRTDWHIYLSETIGFDLQSERLDLVLKEKIGSRRFQLEYIDLRYDERIFFRYDTGE
jgi:hypothetical protein